jgi:fumarate hydratase class II
MRMVWACPAPHRTRQLRPHRGAGRPLWGAQTQRSLAHFDISGERLPTELLHALARIKGAAARVNAALGELDAVKADAIAQAAHEVLEGRHAAEFPLVVWQTGSGTQSNMNMNEVLANRASQLLGGPRGSEARLVHPNDDVNLGQSSNDVFPTAMHVAALRAIEGRLLPALDGLHATLDAKAQAFAGIVKIGRTHLQDATPLTLGQEISGWVAQLAHARAAHRAASLPHLRRAGHRRHRRRHRAERPPGFGARMAAESWPATAACPFVSAPNKFAALAAPRCPGAARMARSRPGGGADEDRQRRALAGLGPARGLGELRIPENEPGSSIMPGKVNPTQCEALTMAVLPGDGQRRGHRHGRCQRATSSSTSSSR